MKRVPIYYASHHANRGRFAEELLNRTHQVYRLECRALITQIPTPVGRRRRRDERAGSAKSPGEFTAFYKRKTVADYLGVMTPWIPLALELKSIHKRRWYASQLADHQSLFLDHWVAMGGLAYLLVVFAGHGTAPAAAVAKWPDFLREIAVSGHQGHGITWDGFANDLTSTAGVPTDGYIALDYLRAIQAVEARLHAPVSDAA